MPPLAAFIIAEGKSITDALVSIGWSPFLLIWAWTQGEPAVIAGGALAAEGYWHWYEFCLAAAIPSAIGHQIYYWVGKRFGTRLIHRLPKRWQPSIAAARSLLLRHEKKILPFMRFAYGVRGPLPYACGMSGIAPLRFFLYNFATALVWALLFTLLGYAFGTAATYFFDELSHYGSILVIGSLLLGIALQVGAQAVVRRALNRRGE